MSNETSRIEIITGRERRRRYSAKHKLLLVEETMQPGYDRLCGRPPAWDLERVGFSPTKPVNEAGMRIDPPPSEAELIGAMPAAISADAPPDDPPGERSRSQGFRVTISRPV